MQPNRITVVPPPRRTAPPRIRPAPPASAKSRGGFFHGLHVVWVLIIGLLAWQNMSQASAIDKLTAQNEAQSEAIMELAKWADMAEEYLHKHRY